MSDARKSPGPLPIPDDHPVVKASERLWDAFQVQSSGLTVNEAATVVSIFASAVILHIAKIDGQDAGKIAQQFADHLVMEVNANKTDRVGQTRGTA